MKYSEREKGKAGIIIELNDGNITVTHSSTKEILKYFPSKIGGWDALFEFLEQWETGLYEVCYSPINTYKK